MTEMMCKLDWFSFTFPITLLGEKDNEYTLTHILSAFHDHTGQRLLPVVTKSLWSWVQSAGFYTHKIQCPKSLITISWNAGNPFALCEISGQAVDVVLLHVSVHELALAGNKRATRLDFAVDFETEVSPEAFTALRNERAFSAYAFYTTETGDTCYVGSRNGERMARVYRYNSPHPRSHLLRAEVEYKGDAAKVACEALTRSALTEVALQCHLPFGWKHPLWQPGKAEISKLPARYYDNEGAGTLKWLEETVVPAIKKADENGLISLTEWLKSHFPKLPL
jgi:hypothetical protein